MKGEKNEICLQTNNEFGTEHKGIDICRCNGIDEPSLVHGCELSFGFVVEHALVEGVGVHLDVFLDAGWAAKDGTVTQRSQEFLS